MMPSDRLTNADTSAVAPTKRGCSRKGSRSPETTAIAAAITGIGAAIVVDRPGQNIGIRCRKESVRRPAPDLFSCPPEAIDVAAVEMTPTAQADHGPRRIARQTLHGRVRPD